MITEFDTALGQLLECFSKAAMHNQETAPVQWQDVEIVLRRVSSMGNSGESIGNFIPFHVDYAYQTLHMTLNEEYVGGQLLYLTRDEGDNKV